MKITCLWLLSLGFLLGAGSIQTRDGKAYRGELVLDDASVIVRPEGGAAEVRLPWKNVRSVIFSEVRSQMLTGTAGGQLPQPWRNQDIGRVHISGSATCSDAGTLTLKASGWGAWAGEDSLHYVYRPFEGDGQILARVANIDATHGVAVVGVMIRQSLSPDSLMAGACLYPTGEVRLSRRPATETPEPRPAGEAKPGSWLRLTRRGDLFTAYWSTDGKTWVFVESRIISMPREVLVGLAAWTPGNASLGHVTLDAVTILLGASGSPTSLTEPGVLEGAVLRDGTVLAGTIAGVDGTTLKLVRAGREMSIARDKVARLILRPPPADLEKFKGKTGLLLADGVLAEGEVTQLTVKDAKPLQRRVGLKSVLFGVTEFDVMREAVVALLADVSADPAAIQVRTADGSVLRAKSLTVSKDGIVADGTPVSDVVEVRYP